MLDVNYKELDAKRLVDYLESADSEVSVDDLIAHSGAEKLRIYPLLFELECKGVIDVCQQSPLGAPTKVKFIARE